MQEPVNGSSWRARHRIGRSVAVAGLAVALTGGMLAQAGIATAQDAKSTPAPAVDCRTNMLGDQTTAQLVDLSTFLPVTALVTGMAAPAATPASSATAAATTPSPATPAATPVSGTATPAATASKTSTVDDVTANELQGLAFAIVNCTSQSDIATLTKLVTDTFLAQTYAGGAALDHEDLVAIASVTTVPQQALLAFDNLQEHGDAISAEVIYTSGNQLLHERWTFVKTADGSGWLLDTEETLPALTQEGASITSVTIRDNGMKTDPREVDGPDVVIHGKNADKVEHEVLVLRLPEGATTDILLESPGPNLPEGVDFIGQITVPAGGEALLPLIDLPAGNYVVVDMLLDDSGTPYLADGLKARLIVK